MFDGDIQKPQFFLATGKEPDSSSQSDFITPAPMGGALLKTLVQFSVPVDSIRQLPVFLSEPLEANLELLHLELNRTIQLLKTTEKKTPLLVIFTSKRAVSALYEHRTLASAFSNETVHLTAIGSETTKSLVNLFPQFQTKILPPAETDGILPCITMHKHRFETLLILGTRGGISEQVAKKHSENETEQIRFYEVYRIQALKDLGKNLLLSLKHEGPQILCCTSGTTVNILASCFEGHPQLKMKLQSSLFFLPIGYSANLAVNQRGLPTWKIT